jgi:hypothetical protein
MATPDRLVEVYPAKDGWRWRRVVPANGNIVADGAEAYTRKDDAREAATNENPGVSVVVLDR